MRLERARELSQAGQIDHVIIHRWGWGYVVELLDCGNHVGWIRDDQYSSHYENLDHVIDCVLVDFQLAQIEISPTRLKERPW